MPQRPENAEHGHDARICRRTGRGRGHLRRAEIAGAEEAVDGLFGGFAEEIPEGDIDGGDGDHADAFAAEGHGFAIHVLPEEFDVPGVLADEEGFEVEVDDLLGDLG